MAHVAGAAPQAPRPGGGQTFLTQAATLAWRVPCPPAPGLFAPLEKLRQAAVAAWPSGPGTGVKPEPLVAYAAALFVSARQRPEMGALLKSQGASVLQALAYMYAATKPDAAARAAHLAADTWASLGEPVPWNPTSLVALLDLQAQTHVLWSASSEAATALAIAGLFASPVEEGLEPYHKAAHAFWTSAALLLATPAAPTLKERESLTTTYLVGQYALRERHAEAAVATLESALRNCRQESLKGALEALLKSTREEALHKRNERLAFGNSIGTYIGGHPQSPVDLPPLALPEPAALAPGTPSPATEGNFDGTLRRAMDAWSATDAAGSLGRPAPSATPKTMDHVAILARLLGVSEETVRAQKGLRAAETWRAAVLAACHQYEWAHGLGYGGPDREEGLAKVREARELLRF
jgi:hypothetical protein